MNSLKKASTVETNSERKATGKKAQPESLDLKSEKATPQGQALTKISEEQRIDMIRDAAYFCAEQHGFQCDRSLDDWLKAEADIDSQISALSDG
tara:strand:+ start:1900 stop:2181 length:282 start_codon:yes stop_codon:yes gene_type:complete